MDATAAPTDTPMQRWKYVEEDEYGWLEQVETWSTAGVHLTEERSRLVPFPWHDAVNESFGIGLVRRGAYRRRARGVAHVVDGNIGFLRWADEDVGIAHFTGEPREVTFVTVEDWMTNGLFDRAPNGSVFHVTPQIELDHQRLLVGRRCGADDLTMQTLALDILTRAFAQHDQQVRTYSRRTTAAARQQLVSDACEVLHLSHHSIDLVGLADAVGCSPFHLSRVFREITGLTIPQYRRQLRVHDALSHIAAGATDLASVAAAVGFADHSHMTRSIVAQFGSTPSRLRDLLHDPAPADDRRTVASD